MFAYCYKGQPLLLKLTNCTRFSERQILLTYEVSKFQVHFTILSVEAASVHKTAELPTCLELYFLSNCMAMMHVNL